VYLREFAPRVRNVIDTLPLLEHSIVIEDASGADVSGLDSVEYEAAMASGSPERDFGPRSPDDRYILYTGGTTGMPKGVVWRHEDVFFALGGGIDPTTNTRVQAPGDLVARARERQPGTMLPIAPLMHGASQWSVMGGAFQGNRIVLVSKFDPDRVWRLVESGGGQQHHDHRRRDGPPPRRDPRRVRRHLRLVVAGVDLEHRGGVLPLGQAELPRTSSRTSS